MVLLAAVVLVLSSCASTNNHQRNTAPSSAPPDASSTPTSSRLATTLRELAARRHILLGSAVDDAALQSEEDYRRVLATEFNMVEPENVMKWSIIHPAPHRYDFTAGDRLVTFARAHGMTVRGHTLAWHNQNPEWLARGQNSRAAAIGMLRDHIHTVVGHYRGQVTQWDVVNEALSDGGGYADNPWLRAIGPGYVAMAFRFAREADPTAELYYNDYDLTYSGAKADRILALVRALVNEHVPIDGLGMQFHVLAPVVDFDGIRAQMRAVGALGLDYAITEFDMGLKLPVTAAALRQQAGVARRLMQTCVAAANCHTFNVWGFTDRHSWIPSFFSGYGAATLTDDHLRPKPAFEAFRAALAS